MYSAADSVITSGKVRTGSYPANGLYYCSDGQSEKHYVNIYLNKLRNSSKCMAYNVQPNHTYIQTTIHSQYA